MFTKLQKIQNKSYSNWEHLLLGMPQGSVLGPYLQVVSN